MDSVSKAGWTEVICDDCRGYGVVSLYSYSSSGSDFEGAGECTRCNGSGYIWKSPAGRLVEYPGGKFLGSVSRAETAQDIGWA